MKVLRNLDDLEPYGIISRRGDAGVSRSILIGSSRRSRMQGETAGYGVKRLIWG
jgi:hypothetical protein